MARMTFTQFQNLMKKVADCAGKSGGKIELFAANSAHGIIKPRIFKGIDASGAKLRPYAASTKKTRARKGRQVSSVDLQMSDKLFRSLQVGKFGGKAGFGFVTVGRSGEKLTNPELAAKLEEETYDRVIFAASDKEVDRILKATEKEIFKTLDKCLGKIPKNITITDA